ncbi:MAG TPA: peptidase M49 [Thermoanaerobaculia bacterium]|nr:peptidase M49 [Thermoanaerobaculia bacterium]
MNLRRLLIPLAVLLAAPLAAQPAQPPSPLAGRIGDRGFLQVEAPSFAKLPLQQKLLAWHLTRAAIQLDPIFYDQMSAYGLTAKRLLGALAERPERLPAASRQAIVEYATLFFGNDGNHNETTGKKFLPGISFEELSQAAEAARAKGARLGTREQLAKTLKELQTPLFDPNFQPNVTEKNPPAGEDILTASSNNYYQGVTLKDLAGFAEKHPLNSRLVKRNGQLVEEVYRAGTPDGKLPPGLYAKELAAVNRELEAAAGVADPEQARVLRALVRYYRTGDPKDWHDYNVLWLRNDATVDFASGFIEVYRDARGAKGSAQMVVAVVDQQLAPLMHKLADNAVYFEKKAPWDDRFKKLDVKPPVAKAIETLAATGDFHVGTIGDNLPNEQDVREQYGTKSILLTSSVNAFSGTRGAKVAVEFLPDADEGELFAKHGAWADNLHTALHEIIGHGSGKVTVPNDPPTYLRELYSTLEEARADLVAYWNVYDPKLAELGVPDVPEVGRELYRQAARAGLVALKNYPTGDTAAEDHDRSRLLVANYLIEAGAFARVQRNGHWYVVVKDYDQAHAAVGRLLAEVMRIKATGDYAAGKALVDKYGVHFDPAVRDDVAARYKKLQLPVYSSGIYADLAPVRDQAGKVTDVAISYPRDFLAQQLAWARENGTLGF